MIRNRHSTKRHPAKRHSGDSPLLARYGFSLVEMLIVMAILTLFAAFALPSLFGPLDKSRLRGGARDVQAALGKARTMAIREGRTLEFRYEVDGRRWKIEHRDPVPVSLEAGTMTSSGLSAESGPQENSSGRKLVREGWLPEGTTFRPTEPDRQAAQSVFADDGLTDDSNDFFSRRSGTRWSPPIAFFPNGRSEDAELQLAGSRDFVVAVAVRGLTSAVSFSEPFRRRPSEVALLTDGRLRDRSARDVR